MLRGFKFGLILQLAVGPVCLFIFQLAGSKGFLDAESGVLAVVLIDVLFILLAISGITSFIKRERVKYIFKLFGAVIVGIFGLQMILGTFAWETLPKIDGLAVMNVDNSFLKGIVITASNPLTILFWARVFATKLTEEQLSRKDIYLFGIGAVFATLVFLTLIAIVGSIAGYFLPVQIVSLLNIFVGIVLLYCAFRMIVNKNK